MKIVDIERKKINRLKRKLNQFNKNLSQLDEEQINNKNLMDKIYFINQNIYNLENFIDLLNTEMKNNFQIDNNISDLIEKDQEAQEILDKFLPLMLYYQMVKNNNNNNKIIKK
tara:strand:+ start:647 stop:985 length:339 start_codon:yes stop_codon:yes gene_type:complete